MKTKILLMNLPINFLATFIFIFTDFLSKSSTFAPHNNDLINSKLDYFPHNI